MPHHSRLRTAGSRAVLVAIAGGLVLSGCGDAASQDTATVVQAVPTELIESLSEAELQDMQTIAEQTGRSPTDVIAAMAWQDDFSALVEQVRAEQADIFARAQITGDQQAALSFTADAPASVRDLAAAFEAEHGVTVVIDTDGGVSEQVIEVAVPTVHMALLSHPDVVDATTSFEAATNQVVINVVLAESAAADLLSELQGVAADQLAQTSGVPDDVTAVVRESAGLLGSDDN